jgi:hypothetical protein
MNYSDFENENFNVQNWINKLLKEEEIDQITVKK